jgi:uncharacterized protein YegL
MLRPGDAVRRRPYHVVWILDSSSGMVVDGKLAALNKFIREIIPHLKEHNAEYPNIQIHMSAVTYGTGARWHLEPTPVEYLVWPDIFDFGRAEAGPAFQLVEGRLRRWLTPGATRLLPPFLIWVAGSKLTGDWEDALDALSAVSRRVRATRLAFLVGKDAPYSVLEKFIGNAEIRPLLPDNPEILLRYIRIDDEEVVLNVDNQTDGSNVLKSGGIPIPPAPPNDDTDSSDVW